MFVFCFVQIWNLKYIACIQRFTHKISTASHFFPTWILMITFKLTFQNMQAWGHVSTLTESKIVVISLLCTSVPKQKGLYLASLNNWLDLFNVSVYLNIVYKWKDQKMGHWEVPVDSLLCLCKLHWITSCLHSIAFLSSCLQNFSSCHTILCEVFVFFF